MNAPHPLRLVAVLSALSWIATANAQDRAISYQGQLKDAGAVIPGPTDFSMTFRLFDAASGGNLLESKGRTVTVVNSVFTTALDFAVSHFNGADRWLEIQVGATTLTPRQELRWAPYAIHALNAADRNSLDASDGSPADVVFVDAAGLTGVGTTAPAVKLNVVGGTDATTTGGGFVQAGASTGANVVLDDNEIMARNNSTLAPLYLQNDGGSLILCQNAGNVGIGTDTPGFPLSFSNATGDKISLWGQSGDHYGFGIRANLLQIHSNIATADIAFGYGTSAAMTETMRIRGNGNVGIGTASPAQKLSVTGTVQSTTGGFMFPDGTVQTTAAAGGAGFWSSSGTNIFNNNTGSVGIGINTPATKLHVKADQASATTVRIENLSTSTSAAASLLFRTGGSGQPAGVASISLPHGLANDTDFSIDAGALNGMRLIGTSVNLPGVGSFPGLLNLINAGDDRTVSLSAGNNTTSGTLTMYDPTGATQTVRMIGNGGGGGGALELYNSAGQLTIGLDGDEADHGDLQMYRSNGTATIIMEASEDGTDGAQIALYNSAGQATIVIDADQSGVGRVTTDVLQITGADLAEKFPASEELQPGMVVAIDVKNEGQLCLARGAYNRTVAGVVSGANDFAAGAILGNRDESADGPPIALAGRVYVWVDADAAPVRAGDLLTTSDTPGHAMKVLDHAAAPGAILGKAMTSLESGRGLVLVLVSLQ